MNRFTISTCCFSLLFSFSLFAQEKLKLKIASSRFRFGIEGNYLQNTTEALTSIYTTDDDKVNAGYYGALNFEFFIDKGRRNASFYTQLGYLNHRYIFYKGFGSSAEKYDITLTSISFPIELRYRLFAINKKRSGWLFCNVGFMNLYTLNSERLLNSGDMTDFKSNNNSYINNLYFGLGLEINKLVGIKASYMQNNTAVFKKDFRNSGGSSPDEINLKTIMIGLYLNFIK